MQGEFSNPPSRLRPGVRHQLVMAVKEALSNALKHSKATDVQVRMLLTERLFTMAVRDNGVGFAERPNGAPQKRFEGGHGLPNLRARVESVGGVFRISSAPGAGALVLMEVPISAMTSQKNVNSQPANESDQSRYS